MSREMEYDDFLNAVVEFLTGYYGEGMNVKLHSVYKNNAVELDGISLINEASNISPTIYLNQYYTQYCEGRTLESICEDVICIYEQNRCSEEMDISFFESFDEAQKHIVYKLISYTRNRELLKNVPHTKVLDLAVVYYYIMEEGQFKNATILIRNEHMQLWQTTVNELDRIAKDNAERILKADIRGINSILQSFLPFDADAGDERMYVISNQKNYFGAACIFYQNTLHRFSDELKTDLFILPSSVHEMILIPVSDEVDVNHLKDMVKEVNATEVCDEEVLSDNVYYYSARDNQIVIA